MALERLGRSRRSTLGAVGAAIVLVACCAVAPLVIGTVGFLAVGIEVAAIAAVVVAVVAVIQHRRSCGCDCNSRICQSKTTSKEG